MVSDSTPSRIYTASCFEDKDHSTTKDSTAAGGKMMKQPLIIMGNESLEGEGQTKLQKQRQSRSAICKCFLLGSSIGVVLQVMSYAAYYTRYKMFGVLLSLLCLAIYVAIWLAAMLPITKSGSLYMRKKFDKNAANPNSGSIWTTGMMFMFGIYFLFGVHAGSFSFLVILNLFLGSPLMPLMSLFMMMEFATFLLMGVWFDQWREPIDQELGYDLSFVA
jgi:hypothetical protein